MTLSIASKTLSDYDAQWAFNTATAFLRKSPIADYLIKQLEKQKTVTLTVEVYADPAQANRNTSDHGVIEWSVLSNDLSSNEASEVTAFLSRTPIEQKPYLASQLNLLHLLALACQQLNNQLDLRDADAPWPWLDEKTLSAVDIENHVARELSEQRLPDEQNWDRILNGK